jgi:hypothetical protein
MMKYATLYGVILGIILIVWLTFDYIMGYYGQNKTLSNLNYLARIAGIFVCILVYRNRVCGGYISFGRAFGFGLSTFLVAMVLLEIFVCMLVNIVDPDYLYVKATMMTKQLSEAGMHSQRIGEIINLAIYMEHPVWAVLIAILGGGVVSSMISLISALILKKEEKKPVYRKPKLKMNS